MSSEHDDLKDKLEITEAAMEKWMGRTELTFHKIDARFDKLIAALSTE